MMRSFKTLFLSQYKILLIIFLFVKLTPLDKWVFEVCNGSLALSSTWAGFWAIMNHQGERLLNIAVMLIINFIAYFQVENKKAYIKRFFGALLILEIGIAVNYLLFQKVLNIYRSSPTLIYDKFISLQAIYGNPYIKVYSSNSFPSGHAFTLMFWALICYRIIPRKFMYAVVPAAILFSTNRLFSGGHWLSDIIASYILAKIWSDVYTYIRQYLFMKEFAKIHTKVSDKLIKKSR
ncbi:MAG: phosphatase PAP2 family protein [Sphingobacteriia bacterium]|nr:phosphatase PAP2 family protein [Sphingobacteriia bacterium]